MDSFYSWFQESSQGANRSLRKRLSQVKTDLTGGIPNDVSYSSNTEALRGMQEAMRRAQEMNRQNGGFVRVYHMITPHRTTYKFPQLMAFLNSRGPQEISVSVEKGIWNANAVLEGEAKLFAYWPTDINSFYVPGSVKKFPRAPKRPNDSHHWDEALVRLADVNWDTLYVSEDTDTIYMFGGWDLIVKTCRQHDIRVEHSSYASHGSAIHNQYELQSEIQELTERCMNLAGEIRDLGWRLDKGTERQQELLSQVDLDEFRDYLPPEAFMVSPEEQRDQLAEEVNRLEEILQRLTDIRDDDE